MNRLLRIHEVELMVSLTGARIYELIKAAQFPQQVRVGGAALWSEREVQQWIDERLGARTGPRWTPAEQGMTT